MNELPDKSSNILSPRKINSSLASILQSLKNFGANNAMNEDNFLPPRREEKNISFQEENCKIRNLPLCQFYIPEKSSKLSNMEVDNKAFSKSKSSHSNTEDEKEKIAERSFEVNILARSLNSDDDSSFLPNEDFDCSMNSSGALAGKSSSASGCLEMSYLTNTTTKPTRKGLLRGKHFLSVPQEKNLFPMKRKRPTPSLYSPEHSGTSSNNSSFDSCPSVSKKVKFYPLITSTPTKQPMHADIDQYGTIRKVLSYGEEPCFEDNSQQNKLEQNIDESGSSLLLNDANMMSQLAQKSETSPVLTMNHADERHAICFTQPHQPISNLVEKFSSKIRVSLTNESATTLNRKPESIDSSEDCNLGIGKYDAKYPTDCVTIPTNIRLNTIAQDLSAPQYKPLKHSFDDSYKLAPIQENNKKLDEFQSTCHYSDYKSSYLCGRQRCLGFDSKIKPKTRLRRRYKSESDLFERVVMGEPKQRTHFASECVQDVDDGSLISNDMSMDGANIKLYSLTDPDRNSSQDSEAVSCSVVGQESVMEIFCEQMHDLQMDNT